MAYEFTPDENRTIDSLAGKMGVVGLFLWLTGLAVIVAGLAGLLPVLAPVPELPAQVPPEAKAALDQWVSKVQGLDHTRLYYGALAGLLQGVILIAAGHFTRRSAKSMRAVVNTSGHDISHLMQALGALRNAFSLGSTLLILGLLAALGAAGLSVYLRYLA